MKKNRMLIGFSALCLVTFSAISCGNDDKKPDEGGGEVTTVNVTDYKLQTNSKTNTFSVGQQGAVVPMDILPLNATKEFTYVSADTSVLTVNEINGTFKPLKKGKTKIIATSVYGEVTKEVEINVTDAASNAKGGINYQALDYEEKAEVIGKLEGWAMDNHLTGITLFQNGGYVLYNPRLELGAEEYIPGFGYGNLSDGKITKPAELVNHSTVEAHKNYYHAILTTNPSNINYLNSQGEVVGDLYGYISAGLWNTKMNSKKNGYEWYPVLAKGELEIDQDHFDKTTGLGTVYRVKVKTGKNSNLVYRTLGKRKNKYDGREVVVEDYINAYKQLLTKSNNLSRGAELTSISSEGTLKGAAAYYNLSSHGVNDAAFKNVGIKAVDDETIEFTLAKPTTPFYAKYSLSSSLTMPFPEEFVKDIGGMIYYGAQNPDDPNGKEVQDNILCLGPYMLEKFDNQNGGEIIFKKNDKFIDNLSTDASINQRYQIPGIHNVVREGLSLQQLLEIYEQGVIDACGVPQDKMKLYADKPECHRTLGDSTFKLNVNSATQEEWDYHEEHIFSESSNHHKYSVKPIMSNDNFLKGLNESIDRKQYAEDVGAVASQDYFGGGYLYDPEAGKAYNDTPYHKANLASRFPETYGYNFDAAVAHFKKAVNELVNQGAYDLNDPKKNHETIEIWWMNTDDVKLYGEKLEQYIEKAFNHPSVSNGKFKLDVVNHKGTPNYEDVYNKHLQVGWFDLGFGSISGNALNPLNFMEVLKSDNSSGFTLNWGRKTSEVDPNLVYDGKTWSFDSLWTAANSGAVIDEEGQLIKNPIKLSCDPATGINFNKQTKNYEITVDWSIDSRLKSDPNTKIEIKKNDLITYVTKVPGKTGAMENVIVLLEAKKITDNQIVFEIVYNDATEDTKKESDKILQGETFAIQVNYDVTINGITTSGYVESDWFEKGNDFVA